MSISGAVLEGRRIEIHGTVQGVGFRPWVYRIARLSGVTGRVRNDSAGVTIEAFGDAGTLERFVQLLRADPPPAAHIRSLVQAPIAVEVDSDFLIVPSEGAGQACVSIPPDLATCPHCAAEIADPANRRYRYAFTNCTSCGPRFTIATDIPYDRAATTMAPFRMCRACGHEYHDPGDRRFHAEPNACPVCGPRLTLCTFTGETIAVDDPIAAAAEALRCCLIVAVKGLGGFHLACDATCADTVGRLRERKHRDEKPFAVMAADLAAAEALAILGDEERRLLTSAERPIVLAPKREGSMLAPNVAPGSATIGLFLPYTPLHHLLLADAGVPLVMTSGNLSDEPIAFRNEDAVERLGEIADAFLMHDREIETRCDDSVATVIAGRGVVLRRSRGYVPRAVTLRRPVKRPVLACGALLKNTFCFAAGENAWLGPHIGDLENLETYDSYRSGLARLEHFLQVRPEVIAHDMHPDYLSTIYAERRPEAIHVPVQHHHAHVASAMAEHGLDGPVIGIVYDGAGYGLDGASWGSEILVADLTSCVRAATFRPLPLVGGDRAVREPWRLALAMIVDAFGDDPPPAVWPLLAGVSEQEIHQLLDVMRTRIPMPLAHGAGRYFDAFGALFLRRRTATFEGQVAIEWNQAADPAVDDSYPFDIVDTASPWELDLRPMTWAAVADLVRGAPVSAIAARFHNTIAQATASLVRRAVLAFGPMPVVATGGCFQNARLAESVRAALAPEHRVLLHADVPPGDGGIALGQAVIADAITQGHPSCV
ncbi:MAG: carbamoyltransferase HypF [Vicinamibacterales bacterium]